MKLCREKIDIQMAKLQLDITEICENQAYHEKHSSNVAVVYETPNLKL